MIWKLNRYRILIIYSLALLLFVAAVSVLYQPALATADVTTTRIFTSSASDGYLYCQGSYATAHNNLSSYVYYDFSSYFVVEQMNLSGYGIYDICRAAIFFDTSNIPDSATINNATLSLDITSKSTTTDFNITVQTGGATYPHDPIVTGDYYYGWYSGDGGSANTSTISAPGYWNITLNDDGVSWISLTGDTKFCLRSSEDIASNAPAGEDYVYIAAADVSESVAPKLYVTYTVSGGAQVTVHGPYAETGAVYSGEINVTVSWRNNETEVIVFNGTDGSADTENLVSDALPYFITWNISSSYDYSRIIYFDEDNAYDEVWLFVPDSTNYTVTRYSVGITDFAGISGAYVETVKNVNGTNRIIEKQPFDSYNALPFWLQLYSQYTLKVVSDHGTFTWNLPADDVTTKSFVITSDMVDWDQTTAYDMTITVTRENSTWIEVDYYDGQSLTINVTASFLYKVGYAYTEAYSVSDTGNDLTLGWYEAVASTNYKVNVTAYRNGEYVYQEFDVESLESDVPYWTVGFDVFGDWGFPSNQLPGIIIVVLFFSIGAAGFSDARAGCGIGVIVAAFLTLIQWLAVPVMGLSMSFLVVVFMYIHHGKQTERMEP